MNINSLVFNKIYNHNLSNAHTTTENNGRFKDVPSEILFKIVGYLDFLSYDNLKKSNKSFYVILSNEYFKKSHVNKMLYSLAVRVLKNFSIQGLASSISYSSIFKHPDIGYGSPRDAEVSFKDIPFSSEGILTDKDLNEKLLPKLKEVFRMGANSLQRLNNLSEEEKTRLSRLIDMLSDRFPDLFDGKSRVHGLNVSRALKTIPGYQNIDDAVCDNIALLLENDLRTQAINELYQLKEGLNQKNSILDWSTNESFKFSLDNLLLDDFNVYAKEVFNIFVSSRYEPAIIGELFKQIVKQMVHYARGRSSNELYNQNKKIVEIGNDCLYALEYMCSKELKSMEEGFENINILLQYKINRCVAVVKSLYQHVRIESQVNSIFSRGLDDSIRKIVYIDPLALTPNMLNACSRKLTHETISYVKDRLVEVYQMDPPQEVKNSINLLFQQCYIIGTSLLQAIPALIDLKDDQNFETKIENVCQILHNAPSYSNFINNYKSDFKAKEAGQKVLNQLFPPKSHVSYNISQLEQINNSNLYPLLTKCFPLNFSRFFSSKSRIKEYRFNFLDPNKKRDIVKELYNQIGVNKVTVKFLIANDLDLQEGESLHMDPKSLCRFFRKPELFPTLRTDLDNVLRYFKIVMDSNCPKKVNIPIILDGLKKLNLLNAENLDVFVKTMVESLNHLAHKHFKQFALSLDLGPEKVLDYYELLFNLSPDSMVKIKYKAQKEILLQNFTFNDVISDENYQKVLTKVNNSQKRKLEGAQTPNPKRKK